MASKILVVDDEIDNIQLVKRTLRKHYELITANSADEAIDILAKTPDIDMVLSDHRMPGKSGVELLQHCYTHYPYIIRILITAYSETSILLDAINAGKIHRYIKKPWTPEELLLTIEKAFEANTLTNENHKLINSFKDLFTGTIFAITDALDEKDKFTSGRSKRVCEYSIEIAKAMNLENTELSKIEIASLLHDIGMIGVPERILHKTEKLSDEEFEVIKKHVDYGISILKNIKQLNSVMPLIQYHHERYDGTGYPNGLKGDEIPLGARIIGIADTFDALISARSYRNSIALDDAIELIKSYSNVKFDANVVEAFLKIVRNLNYDNTQQE